MKSMQIRDAKAKLSALVDAAEEGHATRITRHGRVVAVLVPAEDARRLYPEEQPSFGDVLMAYPGGLEFERDQTPLREIDL